MEGALSPLFLHHDGMIRLPVTILGWDACDAWTV
jgi:hypothetical protein